MLKHFGRQRGFHKAERKKLRVRRHISPQIRTLACGAGAVFLHMLAVALKVCVWGGCLNILKRPRSPERSRFLKGCDRRVPPAASEQGALCLSSEAPRHRLPRVLAQRLHSSPAILPVAPGGGALGGPYPLGAERSPAIAARPRVPARLAWPMTGRNTESFFPRAGPSRDPGRQASGRATEGRRRQATVRRLRAAIVSGSCRRGVGWSTWKARSASESLAGRRVAFGTRETP